MVAGSLASSQAACSRNPATGRLQFALISEDEEVALGRKADAQLRDTLELYQEQPAVGAMVERVGTTLAERSERPELPWTFRVVDDPAVNAFALPGGFVYVTRGLLGHLNSEDELAAVLGHEIAHVTARHGAVKMRKQETARRSVGVFRIIDPNLRHIGGIAASTAGLALLAHSRDDENEADDLSIRYLQRSGYDAVAIPEVFRLLSRFEQDAGGRIPTWLSTHPQPEQRLARVYASLPQARERRPAPELEYLKTIDGIVYGIDPRNGYVLGSRFVHPNGGFRIDAPSDWTPEQDDGRLVATSPDERALFVFTTTDYQSPRAGIDAFFADGSMARGELWEGEVGGFPMATTAFTAATSGDPLSGLIGFVDYQGSVFGLVAIAMARDWSRHSEAVAASFASFARLTEPALRDVEPMRVEALQLEQAVTLEELDRAFPSTVSLDALARLNHVERGDVLPKGALVKRVVGFNAARASEDPTQRDPTAESENAVQRETTAEPPASGGELSAD